MSGRRTGWDGVAAGLDGRPRRSPGRAAPAEGLDQLPVAATT
ncbi:hypothetical protein [Nocardiopsis tropica]